ncbi:hypothetical protein ACFE04_005244 [Oxalis oulophora]
MAMTERHHPSYGIISRKFVFFLFFMTSILFIMSWFLVLRSTTSSSFIDYNLLPSSKLFSLSDNEISISQPSTRNRENIIDNEEDKEEEKSSIRNSMHCDSDNKEPLKVFMYDLPPEFHFGLLGWKPDGKTVWPDIRKLIPAYLGGLNLQHSIEYWLTLDLLASEFPGIPRAGNAIRVHNPTEADVIFVPFFSSLCYNRYSKVNPHRQKSMNKELQAKLVQYLFAQKEWQKSGGHDHVILAHHPNSMIDARMKLWPATLILADFGRYPHTIANVEKDVIAPYKHVIRTYINDSSTFDSRPILLYFQGAIYRKDGGLARQELFYLLKDEKDVHFSFGSVKKDGIQKATEGMHSSKFCLNIAGDTPSSNRLFDAIASHCVPVIISDAIELPYEDILDYSEFCIFVRTSDSLKENFLLNLIRNVTRDDWTRMWQKLKDVEHFFEFRFPSQEGDAVQMIWKAIANKVPVMKMKIHRSRRYFRTAPPKDKDFSTFHLPAPKNFW